MSDTELLNELNNALDHASECYADAELKELLMICFYTDSTSDVRKDIQRVIEEINGRVNEKESQ